MRTKPWPDGPKPEPGVVTTCRHYDRKFRRMQSSNHRERNGGLFF